MPISEYMAQPIDVRAEHAAKGGRNLSLMPIGEYMALPYADRAEHAANGGMPPSEPDYSGDDTDDDSRIRSRSRTHRRRRSRRGRRGNRSRRRSRSRNRRCRRGRRGSRDRDRRRRAKGSGDVQMAAIASSSAMEEVRPPVHQELGDGQQLLAATSKGKPPLVIGRQRAWR